MFLPWEHVPIPGKRMKDRDKDWSLALSKGEKTWNIPYSGLRTQQDVPWEWGYDLTLGSHLGDSENLGSQKLGPSGTC